MAITRAHFTTLNTTTGQANNAVSITSTTLGNLLVVGVCIGLETNTVTGITDDAGNTYVQATNALATCNTANVRGITDIWYAANCHAAATVVTVTFTSPAGGDDIITVVEYAGAKTTNPLDSAAHLNQQAATTPLGPSITTTDASVIVAIMQPQSQRTGATAPWVADMLSGGSGFTEYITSGITTSACAFNPTSAIDFCSSAAAFLPAVSAVSHVGPTSFLIF